MNTSHPCGQSLIQAGWDGWGRPIVAATSQPGGMPAPPNIAPQGGAPGLNPDQATAMGAGGPGAYNQPTATRDMPMTSTPGSSSQSTSRSGTGTGTNRPEQYVGWRNYYIPSGQHTPTPTSIPIPNNALPTGTTSVARAPVLYGKEEPAREIV